MSNEPRICLKSLTSRVKLEDYAKAIQMVDTMKNDGKPIYKDLSMLMRDALHSYVSNVELDEQHKEWIDIQSQKNMENRSRNRQKRRSLLSRMFFG